MMGVDKTPVLEAFDLPGTWEAVGVAEKLHIDNGPDLRAEALARGAAKYGTELLFEWPYYPEGKGKVERFWRTLNSEVHAWPGTTLSNPQELKRHGGAKGPVWSFAEAQRRLLLAIVEYNNETYDGPEKAPIVKWREAVKGPVGRRTMPQDPQTFFIDHLPSAEHTLQFEGIKFEQCRYASEVLAGLRYKGVKTLRIHYDPRDVSSIWITGPDNRFEKIPRVHPRGVPSDLADLRRWNSGRAKTARESQDRALLLQIRAAKLEPPIPLEQSGTAREEHAALKETLLQPQVSAASSPEAVGVPEPSASAAASNDDDFSIPDLPSSKVL